MVKGINTQYIVRRAIREAKPAISEKTGRIHEPFIMVSTGPMPIAYIQDPKMVADIIVNKQHTTDKHIMTMGMFVSLLGESFVFAPGDEKWKLKRKVSGQAFYRDKIKEMATAFKDVTTMKVEKLREEIVRNGGEVKIHLQQFMNDIYASIIFLILFGEDISYKPVVFTTNGKEEKLTLALAMSRVGKLCTNKYNNPIRLFFPWWFNKDLSPTEFQSTANINKVRDVVRAYVTDRVQGKNKSCLKDGKDLLDFLLEDKIVFKGSVERIVDQLLDFFLAGTQNTSHSTQFVLIHMIRDKTIRDKLLKDYQDCII